LRGSIDHDAIVECRGVPGRRNFLGKLQHWLFLVSTEGNVQPKPAFRVIHAFNGCSALGTVSGSKTRG
jgi:hypothetical protein